MPYALYLLWGGAIGILSGVLGIGGGILIIPTLVYFFGLNQLQAQGTSIAMLVPPIGLLAAMRYWQEGNVVLPVAVCGALGFFLGGWYGAGLAHAMGEAALKRAFGIVLILIGVRMAW